MGLHRELNLHVEFDQYKKVMYNVYVTKMKTV